MWAEAVVSIATAWVLLGAAFAALFVTFGVQRIDPAARGATVGFRVAIVPGVLIFWPLLATRWLRGRGEPPLERNAHRRRAGLGAAAGQPRGAS